MRRIQFTPDLLPSDVTGVSVFNQQAQSFEFRPGAVFANIVVGDEINRASPKTQSALLECMEEGQVTVDGTTYRLSQPFMVIATQNPIEMEGTFPLPEAQRDRFMARISMGYPTASAELEMLDVHGHGGAMDSLKPVTDGAHVQQMIAAIAQVHASAALKQYIVNLVTATRTTSALRLGASPRSSLQLLRAARASAALNDRDHVIPEDVQELLPAVMTHRVILSSESQHLRHGAAEVLSDITHRVQVPAAH